MMYDKDTILGGVGLFMGIGVLISIGAWVKEDPTNLVWLVLIAVICYVAFKFFRDRWKQNQRIAKEGGMVHKYRILIQHLLSGHTNSKIFQRTSDSVLLGVHNSGGTTLYSLLQTFGKISITWTMESPIYGKHKLEWNFDEYLDQSKMLERMMNDLKQYQTNVMTAY